jgi:nucleoside-diphosphate-sugar epimerase
LVEFVAPNVVGSIRLIEATRAGGAARFVFISTSAVHERILDDRLLDEQHPLWPTSHLGARKAAIEKFVHVTGSVADTQPASSVQPRNSESMRRGRPSVQTIPHFPFRCFQPMR